MLNAHTHGKGLGLHGYLAMMEHLEGIPGAVANGKNCPVAFDHTAVQQFQSGEAASLCANIDHLAVEAHFAAQGNYPLAQILDHFQQHIGTHMGLGIVENLLPGTESDKLVQHPADSGIVHTGVQLAVGKSTCAALTELHIAPFIQLTRGEELLHFFVPGNRILSPFQNDGLQACHGQNQCREHARRTEANHHGTFLTFQFLLRRLIVSYLCNTCPLAAGLPENPALVSVHRHIDGVDHLDVRLFPGIYTAPDDLYLPDFRIGNLQKLRSLVVQLMGIVLRGQRDISNSDHFIPPAHSPARRPELHAHCKL